MAHFRNIFQCGDETKTQEAAFLSSISYLPSIYLFRYHCMVFYVCTPKSCSRYLKLGCYCKNNLLMLNSTHYYNHGMFHENLINYITTYRTGDDGDDNASNIIIKFCFSFYCNTADFIHYSIGRMDGHMYCVCFSYYCRIYFGNNSKVLPCQSYADILL